MSVRRNKWKFLSVFLLSLILLMGFATFCMASGTPGDIAIDRPAGQPPAFPNFYVVGWSVVNFLVLLALLYKFAFQPINNMLEQRSNTIESSIKHAEEVRAEVEEMRKEAQANLNESRKEAQEMINRATRAAEETKNAIVTQANEEVAVMKGKARAEIEAATEAAKMELRNTAATLAIMAAEKVLGRVITEEDHKQMVNQFVNEAGDLLC